MSIFRDQDHINPEILCKIDLFTKFKEDIEANSDQLKPEVRSQSKMSIQVLQATTLKQ
jgi:hypothetical protein